ncbi:MAG: hypothetical protein KA137_10180 [Halioglobus sp.]|nr:hypothetical protein [Halioglobus sp.]
MSANSHTVLVGVHEIELARNAQVNLFNLVGDADSSTAMLHKIEAIAGRIKPARLFNSPRYVFRTSRSRLPQTLAAIPRCIVPRVAAANPGNYAELRAVCREFGVWPMIVRARGFHGGEHMVLLTEEAQLESLEAQAWPYSGIVLIQYVDARNEDGLHHKIRVVMIDGEPYVRHCICSDQWAVHSSARSILMDHDSGLRHREEQFLASFRDGGLAEYAAVFREIYQRIGLDVFGIDFALVDGQILIFEANACMSFVGARYGSDDRYQYLDNYVRDIRRALKKLLVRA